MSHDDYQDSVPTIRQRKREGTFIGTEQEKDKKKHPKEG